MARAPCASRSAMALVTATPHSPTPLYAADQVGHPGDHPCRGHVLQYHRAWLLSAHVPQAGIYVGQRFDLFRAASLSASSVSPRGPHDASSAFRIGVFSPRLSRSSDAWLKARGVHQPPHECGIRAAAAAWPLLHDAALCFSRTAPRVRPPTSPARLRRATGSCTSLRSAWLSCLSRSDRCARSCPRGAR